LTEKLEARKVAAFMYQNDAITMKDLQSVQHNINDWVASEIMLNIIIEVREQKVYNCFLDALQYTNQHHILAWLTNDGTWTRLLSLFAQGLNMVKWYCRTVNIFQHRITNGDGIPPASILGGSKLLVTALSKLQN